MDRNSLPSYTESSAAASIVDTKDFITYVRTHCLSPTSIASPDGKLPAMREAETRSPIARSARSIALAAEGAGGRQRADSPSNQKLSKNLHSPSSLVQPILTPRFAISCTNELLEELGKMMDKDPTLALQTHLAENPTEIEFTKCQSFFHHSLVGIDLMRSLSAVPGSGKLHGRIRPLQAFAEQYDPRSLYASRAVGAGSDQGEQFGDLPLSYVRPSLLLPSLSMTCFIFPRNARS